jgi:hypothetical protein
MSELEQEARAEIAASPKPSKRFPARPFVWAAIALILVLLPGSHPSSPAETLRLERRLVLPVAKAAPLATPVKVWLVERTATEETYSNGLHIDVTFAVSNRPRKRFPVFPLSGSAKPAEYATQPVGIVYHSSESHLAPFEEEQNRRLKQLGRNLLEGVRRERSYHYVIDRFGRVFRAVEESDTAFHAGHSVWADTRGIYVSLNSSFLGVALEGRSGAADEVTDAQLSATRMLTELLRARYPIPAENCVTHAQVSVNPENMQIGFHVDWAAGFPFAAIGLLDNYAQPPASLWAFGFDVSLGLVSLTGGEWKGIELADEQISKQAAAEGFSQPRYRAILRRRYRDISSSLGEQTKKESEGVIE